MGAWSLAWSYFPRNAGNKQKQRQDLCTTEARSRREKQKQKINGIVVALGGDHSIGKPRSRNPRRTIPLSVFSPFRWHRYCREHNNPIYFLLLFFSVTPWLRGARVLSFVFA